MTTALAMTVAMVMAMAMVMMMPMLKMGDNRNFRLERDVNRALSKLYGFPISTCSNIFQNNG